jgi:hypothetical protein
MTDAHIDALQIILNNPTIMVALRKVFADTLATSLPAVQGEDNQVVGEKYRAYHDSTNIVHRAFLTLESYKKTENMGTVDTRHI